MNIERIDKENKNFYQETFEDVEKGKLTIKEILGFEIEGASVFLPRVPCAHINPTRTLCPTAEENASSIFSLAPIYDTIIYPITYAHNMPLNEKTFKAINNISIDDFLIFVEKKRIIPYFPIDYGEYDKDFVEKFLEPGLPRISSTHLQLIQLMNKCNVVEGKCKTCKKNMEIAMKDIQAICKDSKDEGMLKNCSVCLQQLYSLGINRDNLFRSEQPELTICALKDIVFKD